MEVNPVSPLLGIGGTIIYIAVIAGAFWLVAIRPQKKREKQIAQMQSEIKVGQTVLLTSGIYGKVVDIINDLFIIEMGLNKSVRVPVKKSQVVGVENPKLTVVRETVDAPEPTEVDAADDEEYEDDEE